MGKQALNIFILAFGCWILSAVSIEAQAQKRRTVVLEVSAPARAPAGTQQKWMEMLQNVGADRVKSTTKSTGTPSVQETETTRAIVINVTGYIVGNQLKLPGGNFSIRDTAGIRELIKRLKDDGVKVGMAEKKAFGLTSEQLVDLHTKFAAPLDFSTRGQKVGDVVKTIIQTNRGLNFVLDASAKAGLMSGEKVAEELKGISAGTSLAAVVRPLGLVVEPRRKQGQPLEIHIVDTRLSKENWPVGWPIEEPPFKVEPKLFDRTEVNIQNFPMNAVLDAIEKKAGVPFFYDHNSLAREGIELTEVRVSLARKQVALMVAIDKILNQSKPRMDEELRVDENGKPFIWITVQ